VTDAVAYLRCSGLGAGTDTWDRQLEAIAKFCAAENFNVLAQFQEDAVAGKLDKEDRPEFQKMIASCAAANCKVIVVERLDRLARRFGTQESLLTYLAAEGLTLYAADSGENVTEAMMGDPMRRALVQIQGIFAELDKNMTIAKLRKARQRLRQANGKCEGRLKFGQKPGEEDTLKKIIELRGLGNRPENIAAFLNSQGYPTRYGRTWHAATVSKIVRREA
jgi:site-specific DNA recombinase